MQCSWALMHVDGPICIKSGFTRVDECFGDLDSCPIVGTPSYNSDLKVRISEIYPAISGEGASQGRACTIVRLVGCNLRCSFCDSKYAYEGGDEISLRGILDMISKIGIDTVLLTGGEPLLDAEIASNLLRAFLEKQLTVYVETNGAISIRSFAPMANIVMDIKCPGSGMHERTLWSNLEYISYNDEIKFVVSDRRDYEYAVAAIEEHQIFKRTLNVFMSPVWHQDSVVRSALFQELSNWMVADRSRARLTLQQHKVIWPAAMRGV